MAIVSVLPILNLALLLVTVPQPTNAANDWSKPCFGGTCSYDLPTSADGPSGTLKIWGADTAISDITTAAGWEILGCDPKALEQNIRIVCRGGSDDSACGNLFTTSDGSSSGSGAIVNARAVVNSTSSAAPQPSASAPDGVAVLPSDGKEQGAVGKIVRLPENCGKQPFARVAQAWIPEDQSIPSNIAKCLVRRADSSGKPAVAAIRLDVNFGAADTSKTGAVNFALVGANVPGAAATGDLDPSNLTPPSANSTASPAAVRRSRIYRPRFDLDKTQALPPIDVNKAITLFDQSLTCGTGVEERLNIGAEAKAHAVITVGVAASGSFFPPKIKTFGVTSSMTADLDGAITVSAGVGGTLDSGKIKIFEVGIPGLDFPGLLSIGPTFEINGQAIATLDLNVDVRVGLSYHIEQAEFTFPQGGGTSGTFSPKDTPLKLTAQPSASATGSVEAHIIPSLNLGIEALGGLVRAGVFVDLDASASMTLTLEATDVASTTINPRGIGAPPKQKLARIAQAHSRMIKAPRGIKMIGEHYFAERAPQLFRTGGIVDSLEGGVEPATRARVSRRPKAGANVEPTASTEAVASTGFTTVGTTEAATSTGFIRVATTSSLTEAKTAGGLEGILGGLGGVIPTATARTRHRASTKLKGPKVKPTASTEAATTTGFIRVATTSSLTEVKPTVSTNAATSTESTAVPTASSLAEPSEGASLGGCFEVDAALNVNVGADADFFGLFNPQTTLSLFSRRFQLFKKCFGDAEVGVSPEQSLSNLETRAIGLKCNAEGVGEPTEVVNETVAAAQIV